MLPVLESGEETLVGGQAVMEGVMMRAPHSYCVAVRRPDGGIAVEQMPVTRMSEKYRIFKWPVFRGLGTLGQAMGLGLRALRFSANVAIENIAIGSAAGDGDKPRSAKVKPVSNFALFCNLVFSVTFFIFLYKFMPLSLATTIGDRVPSLHGRIAFNAVDGVIRLVIFLGILMLLSRARDIRRVFEYHGAEHKVVFNYESGQPVTVRKCAELRDLASAVRH